MDSNKKPLSGLASPVTGNVQQTPKFQYTTIDPHAMVAGAVGNAFNYYTGQSPYGNYFPEDNAVNYGDVADQAMAVRDGSNSAKTLAKTGGKGVNITPFKATSQLSKVPRYGAALGLAIDAADGVQNLADLYDANDRSLGNKNPLGSLIDNPPTQSRMATPAIPYYR